MVDMKKSKDLFQKTTQVAFESLNDSYKLVETARKTLREEEEKMKESTTLIKDAMNQLETNVLVFHERYSDKFATIVRLIDDRIVIERTHLLEHK